MIHECNINCISMQPELSNSLGIEDPGKWLPFMFDIEFIDAIKMTSDDVDEPLYNCSTIFTKNGEAYIVDTPYKKLTKIFIESKKTN